MKPDARPDFRNLNSADKRRLLARLLEQRNRRVYPMSYAQQRLWFTDQVSPGSPLFNEASCVRVPLGIDVGVLQRTVNEVVRRHATLRTTFTVMDHAPVQIVQIAAQIEIQLVHVSGDAPEQEEAQALALAHEQAQQPFDLRVGPLMRVTVFRGATYDYVLLVMHHIICDGYSMRILADEIGAIYVAFAAEKPSPLPEPDLQYTDFALWQRQWLQGPVLQEQLAYWKIQLESSQTLAIPTDRPRPPIQTINGARVPLRIDGQLQAQIAELAQSQHVTIFMFLFAVFQVLLHRYTGQEDLVVGTPIANRSYRNTDRMIGHFVNTLALRVSASGNPTFNEFLQRTRETAIQAYAHQDVPFERIVEELRPPRDLSRHPVFQVTVQYVHLDDPALQDAARLVTEPLLQLATAKFDLRLDLCNSSEGIEGYLEYNSDLFDQTTMVRMLQHFRTLLKAVVSEPNARLSELPFLSTEELQQAVVDWNATTTDYPRESRVEFLFERQARLNPSAVAVVDGAAQYTYADLDRAADSFAFALREFGVGEQPRVAIYMDRSFEMIVAMLATLKAGAAYIPIDPAQPAQRVDFMLQDAAPNVIVIAEESDPCVHESGLPILRLNLNALLKAEKHNPGAAALPRHNAAYVIYTSGSTGEPKGVVVSHRGIVRLVTNTNYITLTENDRVAHAASCSFDAATFETWGPLLNGAAVVILRKEHILSAAELERQLHENRITTLFLTTQLVNQLVEDKPDVFASLRTLLFGGSAVDPRPIRRLLERGAPERILHVYGPTECTTFATWHLVDSVAGDATTIPIGKPIANTTAFVVDGWGNPVPVGIPGELELGGDGVAEGYLHQPALTAEKFVVRRIPGLPAQRVYRTGDWVRRTLDGSLEFLGRRDRQVKIHGFRVEPAEVEHILSTCDLVQSCAVVVASGTGEPHLLAYVVPSENATPESLPLELRRELRLRVPDYMMPAHIMVIPSLPLNKNGKLDTNALPKPERSAGNALLPATDVERRIAQIWSQVLEREVVGVEENFFDIGGHSILLVRLQSLLKASVAPWIQIVDLFKYPTVRALARALPQLEQEQPMEADAPATQRKDYLRGDSTCHQTNSLQTESLSSVRPDVSPEPAHPNNSGKTFETVANALPIFPKRT